MLSNNCKFAALFFSIIPFIACSKNTGDPAAPTIIPETPLLKSQTITKLETPQRAQEMLLVAAGEFILGSDKQDTEGLQEQYGFPSPLYLDEHPQQKMNLPAFFIHKYEVSNQDFKRFILETQRSLPFEWGQNGYGLTMQEAKTMDLKLLRTIGADHFRLDMDTNKMSREELMLEMAQANKARDPHPVSGIPWQYANDYCTWLGFRLPTEMEWEKAARGPNGNQFPWGNNWDIAKANTGDDADWEEGIAPIGSYPHNKSYYGAFDMAGNVWEWTSSWYQAYKGSTFTSKEFGEKQKVIRGGGGGIGHYALAYFFRGSTRQLADPNMAVEDVGFRCAKDG